MNPMLNTNEISLIAEGAHFSGDFSTIQDIQIDGSFEGRLFCAGKLTIGPKGVVKGDIMANAIDFNGTMKGGKLYAKDTLSLKRGSSVSANLYFQRFAVELDAVFNGSCQVTDPDEFDQVCAPLAELLKDAVLEMPEEVIPETTVPETEIPAPTPEIIEEVKEESVPEAPKKSSSPLFFLKQAEKRG